MQSTVLDSRYSWGRLGLSLLIGLIGNVGMWIVIMVMPAIQAEFGLDRAQASYPYVWTMVGFAAGNFLIGVMVDRFGVVRVLSGMSLVMAAGFALAAISPGIGVVSLLHVLVGLGTAASFGPLIADVSLWFQRRRGIAIAVIASANYLSGAIWPLLLSGHLASEGWRGVYLLLALIIAVTVPPLTLMLRRRLPLSEMPDALAQGAAAGGIGGLSPRQIALILGLAGVACCVAMSMPQVHIVALCVDLGFGPAVGAEMLSLMLLGGVVSRLISGLLADVLGGVLTLLIGSTLQMLALFLYLPFDGLVSLYVVSTIFGLAQGGIVPSYAVIVRELMPAREAGRWVGFVMMSTIVGMALGGWVSGLIYDLSGSYQLAFWNGIVWNLGNIGIITYIFLSAREKAAGRA
ncbi:MFS transporter [Thalassovita mediterranea]|jgi:MFS family permease|uniref:MFS transporter, aromatic acid:H+ symporter (AAHS) family n=1 Tax=Thalassovita mediterranea TaxID=340021 RepID=A0A0P1GPW9_9RHOB|nr:MFS transporter [Thalassovita mediterranea]CUH84511.1 MFS transporter, aromatic acid:H+ symporter (AAHS) family [Thalassovita mediterranea]SIS34355.1 Sugar phosphate permease [Thalassovita mediterranea]